MPDPRTIILKVLLVSLALAAVAGVAAVLATSDIMLRVTATGFATAGAALLMLPLSMMIDRQGFRPAGLLGTGAVVLEFVLLLVLIWEWDGLGRLEERLELTAGVLPPAAGAAMILLVMLPRPRLALAAKAGLASTAAFFVMAMIATWTWSGGSWRLPAVRLPARPPDLGRLPGVRHVHRGPGAAFLVRSCRERRGRRASRRIGPCGR